MKQFICRFTDSRERQLPTQSQTLKPYADSGLYVFTT